MRSETNLKARTAFGIASLIAAAGAFAQPQVLLSDGFGDGDRDNDATLDGVATDPGDTGAAWYYARFTSNATVDIVDDTGSSGFGSAFNVQTATTFTRPFAAAFTPTTLNDGDSIRFSFLVRITEMPIDATDAGALPTGTTDRRFRFGLYNGNGTPLPMMDNSDSTIVDNDTGYVSQIDVGSADGNSYSMFGDKADGILGGSSVALGATDDNVDNFIGNDARRVEMILTRNGDTMDVALLLDGELRQTGMAAAADIVAENLPFTFEYAAFGTSGGSFDYLVDNVLVEYIPAPTGVASTDGFEDGDFNNDLVPDGPVNDNTDIGFTWYKATGNSSLEVDVEDDSAGIGTGNAMSLLTITTSSRKMAAAIEEVTLENPGDEVRFAFDMRVNGFVTPSDRDFRFGMQFDNGTPQSSDNSDDSDDDSGYFISLDTGPSSTSTAASSGDLANGLMGGTARALGSTVDDPFGAIEDDSPRRLEMRLRRELRDEPGPDVVIVEYYRDGVLVSTGVDDGNDGNDPVPPSPADPLQPLTYTFNQIALGTHSGLGPFDYFVDNIEVTSFVAGPMGCNAADLAPPFGILDLDDVDTFITAFLFSDPVADLAPPVGVVDLSDIDAFIAGFLGGCP
ncbi:MAG: GC-type dockerin domain-anchored protein [Planctomycetota bacterium]